MYVSDLDGTLLNLQSRVSSFTASALNRLIADGMLFSIATARTPATVVALMDAVEMRLPVVLMTGALTYDLCRHEYLSAAFFHREAARQIVDTLLQEGLSPMIYYLDGSLLHVAYRPPLSAAQKRFVSERTGSPYKRFIEVAHYNRLSEQTILLFCMGEYDKLCTAYEAVASLPGHESYLYRDIADSSMGYLEIYPMATSKAAAIERLAQVAGADEIVVFGDNRNDIPMFEVASRSYAVENAVAETKACATGIIGSNDTDGVARFLLQEWGVKL